MARRPNRFASRRRPRGPQPKLGIDDVCGNFTIIKYLKYGKVPPAPRAPVILAQTHHWYRVRCACGAEEIHTQQQLIDKRRNRHCAKCQANPTTSTL